MASILRQICFTVTVMGKIDFCHIVTGHGLQALADVRPRCDREVTTQKDLWPRCDQSGTPPDRFVAEV